MLSHRILDEEESDEFRRASVRQGALRSHRSAHVPSKMSAEILKKSRRNSDVDMRMVKRIDSKMVELEDATHFDISEKDIPSSKEEEEKEEEEKKEEEEQNPTSIPEAWEEWKENFQDMKWYEKMLELILIPGNLLRMLSIPLASEENWNRDFVVLTPILGMLVLAVVFGLHALYSFLMALVGCAMSVGLYFLLREDRKEPTKNVLTISLLLAFGFLLSILWVYLIANEIVSVLQALGSKMNVNDTVLGLTVLAWANSAPDTISIAAVAKEGNVQMAIGGVYAGRLFDTAMGLGLGMFISAAMNRPIPFGEDNTAIPSFIALFISVIGALVVVPMTGFQYTATFGKALILLYMIFLPFALMVSFGVM